MTLDIKRPESLVITPRFNEQEAFDRNSIDLRLGSHFLLPRTSNKPHSCPDKRSAGTLHTPVHVPLGKYLVVPAHQTVLGSTLEFIKLPYDVSGQILTKSSIARTFIVVETAPWIHPGYRGCLTLEIANVSNTPLLLYPGRQIAQLVLMAIRPKPSRVQALGGKYLGPVYPEPAEFDNPEDELRRMGVLTTWIVPEPIPCPETAVPSQVRGTPSKPTVPTNA
ncbi:MAG: dCTP deaminase [Bryobacteraceae bacterium]